MSASASTLRGVNLKSATVGDRRSQSVNEDQDQKGFDKLMKNSSTILQVKTLLENLAKIGLQLEQNEGTEDEKMIFIRVSLSEVRIFIIYISFTLQSLYFHN